MRPHVAAEAARAEASTSPRRAAGSPEAGGRPGADRPPGPRPAAARIPALGERRSLGPPFVVLVTAAPRTQA